MQPRIGPLLLGAALVVLPGGESTSSAQKGEKKGSVAGKVTYKGKPLPGGTITLHVAKGKPIRGSLRADGSYSVKDVPPGQVQVTIETESVKAKAGKYVPIPLKYADPRTSGLTYEVNKGTQTFHIELR